MRRSPVTAALGGGAAACGRASARAEVRRWWVARILAFVPTIPLAGANRMCGAGFCRSFGAGAGRG